MAVRGYPIDADALMEKVAEEYGERARDMLYRIIRYMPPAQPEIIRCKDCKHYWTHKCMDSMPIERCDLEQTFYDAEHDFCSLAERGEPMSDSIERQAAIDALEKGGWGVDWDKALAEAIIKDLPPAQPKQRTGKWLWQTGKVKCNQCLRAIRRIDHDGLLNFCPHCGAKMGE